MERWAANFKTLVRVMRAVFCTKLDLLKQVLVDKVVDLTLRDAQLTSGLAVSQKYGKGFVAVHFKLPCFMNTECSLRGSGFNI